MTVELTNDFIYSSYKTIKAVNPLTMLIVYGLCISD